MDDGGKLYRHDINMATEKSAVAESDRTEAV